MARMNPNRITRKMFNSDPIRWGHGAVTSGAWNPDFPATVINEPYGPVRVIHLGLLAAVSTVGLTLHRLNLAVRFPASDDPRYDQR